MRKWTCLIILFFSTGLVAQEKDSLVFSYENFIARLLEHHPMSIRADLSKKIGEAERSKSRGVLDPVLSSKWKEKQFSDKLYYRKSRTKLTIPTAWGVDLVSAYERNEGIFLNPQDKVDEFGLWQVGVEISLLQGLWFNERTAVLDQGDILRKMGDNKRQLLQNQLLYEASRVYLLWQQYEAVALVIEENIEMAKTYLENTKQSFLSGEKNQMDTLQAYITYQDVLSLKQENQSALIKVRQNLNNYLWENGEPVELSENAKPQLYHSLSLKRGVAKDKTWLETHPMVLEKMNKKEYEQVTRRWKVEKLKPKLKVKYMPLLSTSENSVSPNYSTDNFSWGFEFSMPLFLRDARGDLRKQDFKIEQLSYEVSQKQNELTNKVSNSVKQQQILSKQLALLKNNVQGYLKLLEGETEKFNYGESSVFMLNKRQEKYLKGEFKQIKTHMKLQVEYLNYKYYTNQLVPQLMTVDNP